MSDKNELDWMATVACDAIQESLGKFHADEKRERLRGLDRFMVLLWMNNLDDKRIATVAKKLNVNAEELAFVIRFLPNLY